MAHAIAGWYLYETEALRDAAAARLNEEATTRGFPTATGTYAEAGVSHDCGPGVRTSDDPSTYEGDEGLTFPAVNFSFDAGNQADATDFHAVCFHVVDDPAYAGGTRY